VAARGLGGGMGRLPADDAAQSAQMLCVPATTTSVTESGSPEYDAGAAS
jgi:hypothetical protein